MPIDIETDMLTGVIPFRFTKEGRPPLRVLAKNISEALEKFENAFGLSPDGYEMRLGI